MARALQRFGAAKTVVEAARWLGEDEVVYLGAPPLRIDLLRTIDGVDTKTVLGRAVATKWGGVATRVIALEDLLANKRAAGRAQDAADVEALERLARRR